jgi:hypothetical protein
MTGLTPATTYSYRVGDAAGGWSAVFNFSTLPADVGSAAHPLRIVHIGDMGYGNARSGREPPGCVCVPLGRRARGEGRG